MFNFEFLTEIGWFQKFLFTYPAVGHGLSCSPAAREEGSLGRESWGKEEGVPPPAPPQPTAMSLSLCPNLLWRSTEWGIYYPELNDGILKMTKTIVDIRLRLRCRHLAPLCENMVLSTKPEVHNLLRCRRRRTEPRPPLTCAGNLVKFGHVVFEIPGMWADRQTDRHADRNISFRHRGGGQSNSAGHH